MATLKTHGKADSFYQKLSSLVWARMSHWVSSKRETFYQAEWVHEGEMGGFLRERLQLMLNPLDPQRTFISSLGSASGNGDGTVWMYAKHLSPGGSLSTGELLAHDYFLN